MSVFVSINYPGSVNLLSDGAVWNVDDTLREIKRKVTWSERYPVAVTTRGNSGMGAAAQREIVALVEKLGFDQAMIHVGAGLAGLHMKPEHKGIDSLEVLVAGLSETRGLTHLVYHNWRFTEAPDLPFMEFYNPGFLIARGTGADIADAARHGLEPMRDGEDPTRYIERNGAKLFQIMREVPARTVGPRKTKGPFYGLGGHVDLATVTEHGVKVRRLHTWPEDKIGEKIDPFRATKTVVPIAVGMNRQQRRQAERDARKRVA